jgi:hypothetical protein
LRTVRAKRGEPSLPQLLALFQQAQAVPYHLARRGIAAALDEVLDEALELFAERVAGRHGDSLPQHLSVS